MSLECCLRKHSPTDSSRPFGLSSSSGGGWGRKERRVTSMPIAPHLLVFRLWSAFAVDRNDFASQPPFDRSQFHFRTLIRSLGDRCQSSPIGWKDFDGYFRQPTAETDKASIETCGRLESSRTDSFHWNQVVQRPFCHQTTYPSRCHPTNSTKSRLNRNWRRVWIVGRMKFAALNLNHLRMLQLAVLSFYDETTLNSNLATLEALNRVDSYFLLSLAIRA